MGFRSTITSEEFEPEDFPDWFREKYKRLFPNPQWHCFALDQRITTYRAMENLPLDIKKALNETRWSKPGFQRKAFVYVWLHECGGITRIQVEKDQIFVTSPNEWIRPNSSYEKIDQDGDHFYCSGCSDARKIYEAEDGMSFLI